MDQNSKKKVLSFILTFGMLFYTIQVGAIPAFAETTATTFIQNNIKYQVIEGTANVMVVVNNYFGSYSGSVTIPTTVSDGSNSYTVTAIGDQAFFNCQSLTSITIPESVISIGGWAFDYCKGLTSITIPDSVTTISQGAFEECDGLTNVTIPGSVTSIGAFAFAWCDNLTNVTIPDSVTSIGKGAFAWCNSLTSIIIPNGVTTIADGMFNGCGSLTSVSMPDSIESIGDDTFAFCNSLASVTIPDSVSSIGLHAFYGCGSLANVTIPDNITSIEEGTFYECTSLTSITIPSRVTSIDKYAFMGCTSLSSITFAGKVPPSSMAGNAFLDISSGLKIYVPNASKADYMNSSVFTSAFSPGYEIIGYGSIGYEITATLTSPSNGATDVPYSTSAIELTFNQTVTAVADKAVMISDGTATYTYTNGAIDTTMSGTGINCKATIPILEFKNGATPLTFSYGKTYSVTIESSAYKDGDGNEIDYTTAGIFTIESAPTDNNDQSNKHNKHNSHNTNNSTSNTSVNTNISENSNQTTNQNSDNNGSTDFTDIQNYWAKDAITYVVEKGLLKGTDSHKFSPDKFMDRGMAVTVLGRMYELENGNLTINTSATFSDVAANAYYTKYVAWATDNNIVRGISSNQFAPEQLVTREQLAVMLYNYAKYIGKDVSGISDSNMAAYSDSSQVSDWAKTAMEWALAKGLISGKTKTTLDPHGTATRAEVAIILQRFAEK